MKISRSLFLAGIFLLSLFASRSLSLAIFHPYSSNLPEYTISNQMPLVKDIPFSKQLNLIIIQTDQSKTPQPIGIWWVAIAPETPVTLISIYPNAEWESESWVSEFQLIHGENEKKHLSPDFIEMFNELGIPWDGYLILEPAAMEILIDSVGGVQIDGQVMEGSSVIQRLMSTAPNSIQGRAFQTDVWQKLCQKVIFAGSSGIYEIVKEELFRHTIISPDFPITFSEFQSLVYISNFNRCEVNLLKTNHSMDLSAILINVETSRRNDGN
jgi:hypothetical protein